MEDLNIISITGTDTVQLCGFKIGGGYYAVPVLEVQEVVKPQSITIVPKSPSYIDGLINLRGQVVTSMNLRKLFQIDGDQPSDFMNVIVRSGDSLYSLVVDEILDVMEVKKDTYAQTPETLDNDVRKYIDGVYKLKDKLIILVSLKKLLNLDEK